MLPLDDEDQIAEARAAGVVHGKVNDAVTLVVDGLHLLEPAEAAAHPGGHDHKLRCILIHKTASYPAIPAVHKNSIFCACTSTRAGTPSGTMQRGSAWPAFSPHTTGSAGSSITCRSS